MATGSFDEGDLRMWFVISPSQQRDQAQAQTLRAWKQMQKGVELVNLFGMIFMGAC